MAEEVAMSRTLTLQLDDETYRFLDEAAKAENRPLSSFLERSVLAWIRERRAGSATGRAPSELQLAVNEAEQGIEQGQWVEHAEVAAKLKRWAAGEA
jgi:predicted transcriptional regulator